MKVQMKRLHPDAIIPRYATLGASGFDLHALEDTIVYPGETKLIKTGLSMSIPLGYELQIRPRSGTSLKTSLRVANAPGTVDSDYRGEICIIISNIHGSEMYNEKYREEIKKGDRIAQGVICPVTTAEFEEVDNLNSTERGSGGFGSTGV